jgi:hypothetical protein
MDFFGEDVLDMSGVMDMDVDFEDSGGWLEEQQQVEDLDIVKHAVSHDPHPEAAGQGQEEAYLQRCKEIAEHCGNLKQVIQTEVHRLGYMQHQLAPGDSPDAAEQATRLKEYMAKLQAAQALVDNLYEVKKKRKEKEKAKE